MLLPGILISVSPTLGVYFCWSIFGTVPQWLDRDTWNAKKTWSARGRSAIMVRLGILEFFLLTFRCRTCYIGVLMYAVGFVILGVALQDHLNISALIIGWGIAQAAVLVITVPVCQLTHSFTFLGGWCMICRCVLQWLLSETKGLVNPSCPPPVITVFMHRGRSVALFICQE